MKIKATYPAVSKFFCFNNDGSTIFTRDTPMKHIVVYIIEYFGNSTTHTVKTLSNAMFHKIKKQIHKPWE